MSWANLNKLVQINELLWVFRIFLLSSQNGHILSNLNREEQLTCMSTNLPVLLTENLTVNFWTDYFKFWVLPKNLDLHCGKIQLKRMICSWIRRLSWTCHKRFGLMSRFLFNNILYFHLFFTQSCKLGKLTWSHIDYGTLYFLSLKDFFFVCHTE